MMLLIRDSGNVFITFGISDSFISYRLFEVVTQENKMDKNKIIQSVLMLLPAGVVGVACTLGLSLHPVDIAAPDNTAEVIQSSGEVSEISAVSEAAQPETVIEEQSSLWEGSDTSKTENSRTTSSKSENEDPAASRGENSKTQEKPTQPSSPESENSRSSNTGREQASDTSAPQDPPSTQQENSHTVNPHSSTPRAGTEVSGSQPAQTSQSQQEEASRSSETSRQESTPSSSKPAQESSIPAAEVSEVSEEPSYVPEVPAGRYIDGTYKATAEVDGFDEEGFLYDLEVTVTVSGGKVTAITGKIKNDRSEDPSSNEAYVRRAVKKLSDVIIANQETSGVDVISNATYSSNAVLKATTDALAQAER